MDRFRPCGNTEHYFNQTYQEDAQHTIKPETGQTSAGVAGSGEWGSCPAPGQPQPYLDLNLPAQTPSGPDWDLNLPAQAPSWPGWDLNLPPAQIPSWPDWETSQPTTVAEHEVLSESSAAPVRRRKPRAKGLPPVKERFMAGLEAFARGASLRDCSATLLFTNYIHSDGRMVKRGIPLYDQLSDAEKTQLDQAIMARQQAKLIRSADEGSVTGRFLAGLENYAQDVSLKDCSATLPFKNYVTDNGFLRQAGQNVCEGLSPEDLDRVNQALLRRSEHYSNRATNNAPVEERFLAGLENYARGVRLADCSATLPFRKYVSDSGLLYSRGEALLQSLSEEDQARVNEALLRRSDIYSKQTKKNTKNTTPVEERFLASLDNYERGALLNRCSRDIRLENYLSYDGRLQPGRGQPLYDRLSQDDQERVDKALTARGKIYAQHIAGDVAKFMATLEPYSNGLSLQECGIKSGLKAKASVYFTPEGGLRPKGQR
ncbi:MAG: hypothetical protein P8X74_22300, partial [Reinekea sp.]